MRNRETLRARVQRRELAETLTTLGQPAEPIQPRLRWAQVCNTGDDLMWWTIPGSGYEVEMHEMVEGVPEGMTIALDHIDEHDLWLRWKTEDLSARRELHGSRVHDGRFSILI